MKVKDSYTENTGHNRDTTYYDGWVHLDFSNRASVIIKAGEEDSVFKGWGERFSAELTYSENSKYPEFTLYDGVHSYFRGKFTDTDRLHFYYGWGGRGGGVTWNYYGKRIK